MPNLTDAQRSLLGDWLGDWNIERDHSWPLQDTTVLQVQAASRSYIVKASSTSHHIAREIAAHEQFLGRFSAWVPRLVHASAAQRMLVTEYLPGELVEGTDAEWHPGTYLQAGARMRELLIPGTVSDDYLAQLKESARRSIAAATNLVDGSQLEQLEELLSSIPARPVPLSFTHGDYQPRNWLTHHGQLRVIDFGRAAQRHWTSDLVRLHSQQFVGRETLKQAFFSGLEREFTSEDSDVFQLERIQQAVGTVVWAHGINDDDFEEHGRRMIRMILQGPNP
jgi:aminoglycoside phosphotransferase